MPLENEDDKLAISARELRSKRDLVASVTVPSLSRVDVDGSAAVYVHGLDEPSFTIDADGWANVYAAGRSDRVRVTADGWSDVDLERLSVQTLDLDDEGFADITQPAMP